MATDILADPVLARFRDAVRAIYGDRVERVVLFGSRARGDHGPGSDYDIAVFMHQPWPTPEERDRLARIETELLRERGALISAIHLEAGSHVARTLFMHEVRKDGIDL